VIPVKEIRMIDNGNEAGIDACVYRDEAEIAITHYCCDAKAEFHIHWYESDDFLYSKSQ
jgi:hypothetical protein